MSTLRFSPSNHHDRACLLTAITGRTTPEQAAHSRAVNECDLVRAEAERDAYRHLAAMSRRLGAIDVKAEMNTREGFHRVDCCNGNCNQGRTCPVRMAEMACTAGEDNLPPVRPARYFGVAVILVLACIGLGALTSYFGG